MVLFHLPAIDQIIEAVGTNIKLKSQPSSGSIVLFGAAVFAEQVPVLAAGVSVGVGSTFASALAMEPSAVAEAQSERKKRVAPKSDRRVFRQLLSLSRWCRSQPSERCCSAPNASEIG